MKIMLTGATGLIGSRFVELNFENHEIIPLSSNDADLTDSVSVANFFETKDLNGVEVIIHMAGKTDVDACEADFTNDAKLIGDSFDINDDLTKIDWKNEDWAGNKSAFSSNFIATKNLYNEALKRQIKFVYISTDFVFQGEDEYTEETEPNPINWYGMTKWYGESIINLEKDLVVRLSFPYGYKSPVKADFLQKLIAFLTEKDEVSLIEDQTITPTFIDDIVNGLNFLLQENAFGIYNLCGSSYEDPYHMGLKIKEFIDSRTIIKPAKREDVYNGKAPRPFKSLLKNDKLKHLGFTPKTFDEGLNLVLKKS